MTGFRYPHPLGYASDEPRIDEGTLCRFWSPVPAPLGCSPGDGPATPLARQRSQRQDDLHRSGSSVEDVEPDYVAEFNAR